MTDRSPQTAMTDARDAVEAWPRRPPSSLFSSVLRPRRSPAHNPVRRPTKHLTRRRPTWPPDPARRPTPPAGRGNPNRQSRSIRNASSPPTLRPEQRAIILTNRGNIYFGLGEQETATADFDRAIELNPNSKVAYYNRGLAAFVIGRYDDAIADSSEAIRVDPTMAAAFYNRARRLRQPRRLREGYRRPQ